jgi:hypothetical protein
MRALRLSLTSLSHHAVQAVEEETVRRTPMLRLIDEIHAAQQRLKDEIARKVRLNEISSFSRHITHSFKCHENEELQLALEHAQAGHGIATPRRNESLPELNARPLHSSTAARIVAYEGFALLC